MNLSLKIATFSGIPVRLHVSMLIVPFLAFSWVRGSGAVSIALASVMVVLVFGSILAHELGHALTARKFGVHTKDIILTPIGGMARIVNMTTRPLHEILIAAAGPLVSLALAAGAFVLSIALNLLPSPAMLVEILVALFWVNVMLGLFNLIPALPMDGGRILRGVLAMRRDYVTATRLAARVGKIIAATGLTMGIVSWAFDIDFGFNAFNIILISMFVFLSAGAEERMAAFMRARAQASAGAGPFSHAEPPKTDPPPGGPYRSEGDTGWAAGGQRRPRTSPRVVVIQGGKAEVISRKDPDRD